MNRSAKSNLRRHAAIPSTEAWQALHIGEVKYPELQRVLCEFFNWRVWLSPTGDRFEDSDTGQHLYVHFSRKGQVSSVKSNLNRQLLSGVELHIRRSLLDNQTQAAWQTICFTADQRVAGSFGYKDMFRMLPVPNDAPQAPMALADHPFVLEFSYVASQDSGVRDMRRSEKITQIIRTLNVISRCRISSSPRYVQFFWAQIPKESLGSRWLQAGYSLPNFSPQIDDFSPTTRVPGIQLQPVEEYSRAAFVGDNFALPDSVGQYLDAVVSLDGKNATRFAIASAWLYQAGELTRVSSSSALVALISAIEALLDKQSDTCATCGQPTYSVAKRFKSFLKGHVPDVEEQYPTELRLMYKVRSRLVHGAELLMSDLRHWEFLGGSMKGTTGYAAVRPRNLLAATIPLPPLDEQQRIVARIEAPAAKVEEAHGLRAEVARGGGSGRGHPSQGIRWLPAQASDQPRKSRKPGKG